MTSQSQPCADAQERSPADQQSGGDVAYRGWTISYDPPPIPTRNCDWQFAHRDYDGPEDNRCGSAASLEAAMAEIDEREDDL